MTRKRGERDNGGKQGKGCQGTCIKDTWTKPKGVGLKVGDKDGRWGVGGWRQLLLNNNKINREIEKEEFSTEEKQNLSPS